MAALDEKVASGEREDYDGEPNERGGLMFFQVEYDQLARNGNEGNEENDLRVDRIAPPTPWFTETCLVRSSASIASTARPRCGPVLRPPPTD